ncbi:MAG TPA: sigma-54 dependent transcriptional regulator [Thermodesulfobacteriota bacterium]|nr:sigma-54 dependent transcriptional regulator [Thermodesulfobacteriota bacterium]
MKSLLIVDDEVGARESLKMVFKEDYEVLLAKNAEEALWQTKKQSPDVILLDILLPDMDGLKVLERIRQEDSDAIVIMITATRTVRTAVEAMKLGAYDYVTKPFDVDELRLIVSRAISNQALQKEVKYLRERIDERFDFGKMIGRSQGIREIFHLIQQIAPSKSTVLVMGESGTGKELVSRAIHYQSPRKSYPFITINCAAIPETLIESELFGHEKGAFTNAIEKKLGRCELAHQGTLFLDEIGELSLVTQSKILRFLEEKEISRVGGSKTIKVDVRLIAATNKDLTEQIRKGEFREDLYYRINVVPIVIPPLRERREDIPLLIEHFVKKFNDENNKKVKGVSEEALEWMVHYEWPGNVRELENLIERMVALTPNEVIQPKELPFGFLNTSKMNGLKDSILKGNVSLLEAEETFEKELISDALKKANYVQSHAAELLGISRRILKYKMDKLGIPQDSSKIPLAPPLSSAARGEG